MSSIDMTSCWTNLNIEEVEALDDGRLEAFTSLTDSQLRNRLEPEKGIFIAESGKVIERAFDAGYEPVSFLMERKWLDSMAPIFQKSEECRQDAGKDEIPVFVAPREVLMQITGYDVTRGALAAFRRKSLPDPVELLSRDPNESSEEFHPESFGFANQGNSKGGARRIAVLEDITNASNVGSIFRCAAALGIDAILVTPGCCDPLYRRSIRVSMGAVFKIPWTYTGMDVEERHAHGNVARNGGWTKTGIPQLRKLGFEVVSLALSDDAVSIDDPRLKDAERLAIVLGTEGDGLSDATIAASDHVAMIPMSHGVDSLNVSVASAIAFWELCK